jgi:hypothetical protein
MAKEISRSFDSQQRRIIVTVEDAFGHQSQVSIFVTKDKCPSCGGGYAMKTQTVQTAQMASPTSVSVPDVDTIVQGVIAQLDEDTATAQAAFAAAGQAQS